MKKITFLLGFLILGSVSLAQNAIREFETFNGTSTSNPVLIKRFDQSFKGYVFAVNNDSSPAEKDPVLVEYDATGAVNFSKSYQIAGTIDDEVTVTKVDASNKPDRGYFLTTRSDHGTGSNIAFIKTDVNGDVIWSRAVKVNPNTGGLNSFVVTDVQQMSDYSILVLAEVKVGYDDSRMTLFKVNPTTGTLMWTVSYDLDFYQANENEYTPMKIIEAFNGDYIVVVKNIGGPASNNSSAILQINQGSGNIVNSAKLLLGDDDLDITCIEKIGANQYLIGGELLDNSLLDPAWFLTKISDDFSAFEAMDGTPNSISKYSGTGKEQRLSNIHVRESSIVLMAWAETGGSNYPVILTTDYSGAILSSRRTDVNTTHVSGMTQARNSFLESERVTYLNMTSPNTFQVNEYDENDHLCDEINYPSGQSNVTATMGDLPYESYIPGSFYNPQSIVAVDFECQVNEICSCMSPPALSNIEFCGISGTFGWATDPFAGFPGGATYSWTYDNWSGGGAVFQPSYTGYSIPNLGQGTYTVTVTISCDTYVISFDATECCEPESGFTATYSNQCTQLTIDNSSGSPSCTEEYRVYRKIQIGMFWVWYEISGSPYTSTPFTISTQAGEVYKIVQTLSCPCLQQSFVYESILEPCVNGAKNDIEDSDLNTTHYSIYPNPAKDHLTVDFKGQVSGTLVIRTIEGKALMTEEFVATTSVSVDLGDVAPGTYMVEIYSNNTTELIRLMKK